MTRPFPGYGVDVVIGQRVAQSAQKRSRGGHLRIAPPLDGMRPACTYAATLRGWAIEHAFRQFV
jgi:hypothetical protein